LLYTKIPMGIIDCDPKDDPFLDFAEESAAVIGSRVDDPSAAGIARAISNLVSDGELEPGVRLPTVRALAELLGVSANTVADAWKTLQHHRVIATDGRRGTRVQPRRGRAGTRSWQVPVPPGTMALDLSTGTPDRALLPPLGPVLHKLHGDVVVSSYVDPPVLPELEAELIRRWPFEPEGLTVVDGAQDALDRIVNEIVRYGDAVVVEDPTFPPLIDMLEMAGAQIVGVGLDDEGPVLSELAAAMELGPVALFTQPRAHNPTGTHTSRARTEAIADLVAGTSTIVVEDDHSGGASGARLWSVGEFVPTNVLHIHSFSKSHGPDLRIAALGGPAELIDKIVRRRQLGPAWTSRLIQQILLTMLTDPDTELLVEAAAACYLDRRNALVTALILPGVEAHPGVGLHVWIPVVDEQQAAVALAAQGIGVSPGRPFRVGPSDDQHIRLSLGGLSTDIMGVAATVGIAARGQ